MTKIVVFHRSYGCQTGCCGHVIRMGDDEDGEEFEFDHPYGEDHLEFAKNLVRQTYGEEHVKDLDWENSLIVDTD